jgi:hypothetical protein
MDRVVSPPPGHDGFLDEGALSPDGKSLAVFVSAPAKPSAMRSQLALVNLATMAARTVAQTAVDVLEVRGMAVWTPDGAQVLFCGGGQGPLLAYHPGDAAAIKLDLPCSISFTVFQSVAARPT